MHLCALFGDLALSEVVVKLACHVIAKGTTHVARVVSATGINAGTVGAPHGVSTRHVIVDGLVNRSWVDGVIEKHGAIVAEVSCINA